jgi:hypothetical protein
VQKSEGEAGDVFIDNTAGHSDSDHSDEGIISNVTDYRTYQV